MRITFYHGAVLKPKYRLLCLCNQDLARGYIQYLRQTHDENELKNIRVSIETVDDEGNVHLEVVKFAEFERRMANG